MQVNSWKLHENAYRIFAFLWAFQALEEKSDKIDWSSWSSGAGLTDLLVVGTAVLVLWRPGLAAAFLAFCAASLVNFVVELPHVENHSILIAVVNAGLLLHAPLARRSGARSLGTWVMEQYAPAIRLLLILMYLLTVLHKLNTGFLDATGTCATYVYGRIDRILGFLPSLGAPGVQAAIAFTFVVELGIPALLAFRRWRIAGVMVALLFHAFLGFTYPSYSTMIFALLIFFIPAEILWGWRERMGGSRRRLWFPALALGVLALWFVLGSSSAEQEAIYRVLRISWGLVFAPAALAVCVLLLRSGELRETVGEVGPARVRRSSRMVAVLLALFLLASGLGPYLGYKTATAFSMYSNLRTEGGTNHLFIPKGALPLVEPQDDLVQILVADRPPFESYASLGYSLPALELRRLLAEERGAGVSGIFMVVDYEGERQFSQAMEEHPVFGVEPTWLERKLTLFRPVPPPGENICQW
jgi:uncharacterized membrane protein